MMSDAIDNGPQVGPREAGESHPSHQVVEGCPSYSGGGNNCSVDRQTVDLRKNNLAYVKMDSDLSLEKDNDDLACALMHTKNLGVTKELRVSLTRLSRLSDPGSETDASFETVPSLDVSPDRRFWRKRLRASRAEVERPLDTARSRSGSDCESEPQTSQSSKRGRGRPPKTGKHLSQTQQSVKDRAEVAAAQKETSLSEVEMEITEVSRPVSVASIQLSPINTGPALSSSLGQRVDEALGVILKVATKSGHLKGTFQKGLKDAAVSIREAVEVLLERTVSQETRQLQATNARLQAELADLRKEVVELKAGLQKAQVQEIVGVPAANSQSEQDGEFERSIMVKVGTMVNARLEGLALSGRLLPEQRIRPPLAGDKRKKEDFPPLPSPKPPTAKVGKKKGKAAVSTDKQQSFAAVAASEPEFSELPPLPSSSKSGSVPVPESSRGTARTEEGVSSVSVGRLSKRAKKRQRQRQKKDSTSPPLIPASKPSPEGWTVVGKKGAKPKSSTSAQSGAQPKTRNSDRVHKLRSPNTTAVMLSLQPEAAQRGVTYGEIINEAKAKIDLKTLDISAVRFKTTATGARILELPGAASGDKADSLAQKLREVFNADTVKVSRPTKTAEMRVMDLDDSVQPKDVEEAIAQAGECPIDSVKSSGIHRDARSLGLAWVRCPVAAAKKIAEKGRVLVGWVSAKVRLLDAKPFRCFRCLEEGHVRAQCSSVIDRSDICYRCGQVGHKAGGCSVAPHCTICAAANRAADHRLGGPACKAPKPKKRKQARDGPRVSSQAVPSTSARIEDNAMETN